MSEKKKEKKDLPNPDFIARLMSVQAYYQMSQNDQPLRVVIQEYMDHRRDVRNVDGEPLGKPNPTLFKAILSGLDGRLAEVDEILRGHLKGQEKPVEPLLKSILFCGIFEILGHQDIDKSLIINDYLNITHSFYDQGQVSFVNGILDSVAKLLRS
jgi:N utilization substance protein B